MFDKSPHPVRGWYLIAQELFSPSVLADVFQENSGWLQARARSTREIHNTLFQDYERNGMTRSQVFHAINQALLAEGYLPTDASLNPLWEAQSPEALAVANSWLF